MEREGEREDAQLMHLPGVEPRAQAWEACMLPLHYRCPFPTLGGIFRGGFMWGWLGGSTYGGTPTGLGLGAPSWPWGYSTQCTALVSQRRPPSECTGRKEESPRKKERHSESDARRALVPCRRRRQRRKDALSFPQLAQEFWPGPLSIVGPARQLLKHGLHMSKTVHAAPYPS